MHGRAASVNEDLAEARDYMPVRAKVNDYFRNVLEIDHDLDSVAMLVGGATFFRNTGFQHENLALQAEAPHDYAAVWIGP